MRLQPLLVNATLDGAVRSYGKEQRCENRSIQIHQQMNFPNILSTKDRK